MAAHKVAVLTVTYCIW